EEGMVMTLHHHQLVRRQVLRRDVPRLSGAPQADTLALADRVEREPDVLANDPPCAVDHRSRLLRQITVEELAERTLADEADSRRVLFRMVRQPGFQRSAPHFAFLQLADREQRARELLLRQSMEEVALVLGGIQAAQ